jgi:DNA-binding transcriptional ArsR family regulator
VSVATQGGPTDVLQALADPTRRAVFERVARGEATVSQITAGLDVSQPAVSQHLAALRRAGLVIDRRAGRFVYYRAEPVGLAPLIDWIVQYQSFWQSRIERLSAVLHELDKEQPS